MDKNIIKNHLDARFLSEAKDATPGISVTAAVNKKSGAINKDGVKAIEKDVKGYDKDLKKSGEQTKDIPVNKFNHNGDKELEYHNEMEIMNGQEMIEYDREPNEGFKERAKEAIEGSTRMGNAIAANAESTWGASSDDFGKNLVKNAKASFDKKLKAETGIMSFGNDVETIPSGSKPMGKHSALAEDKNNDKSQIKESMKRLKFKKEFNGVGNALKMIPESYKVDNKQFEMTDGNESYKIRWEGTLSEGRAIVLTAADSKMISEDMQKMKHLMGYKSQETLGLVKGKSRLDENVAFGDIWNKSKVLLEGEEIEDADAKEGDLDDAVSKAPEATKHVEGSVSTDKGGVAPAPKTGSLESLDKAKSQAPEAKAHVEGSESTDKGGVAPAPKTGEWDKISVPQAADAKKHITMSEGVELGGQFFAPINESWMEEEEMVKEEEIEEGYGDDNVVKGMSDEEKEAKLATQPKYTEEEEKKK
jgi:hypothetical protein